MRGPRSADNLDPKVPSIRIPRASLARVGVTSLVLLLPAAQLHAEPANPPAAAANSGTLVRARIAWDRGEFDVAETLYKEAVERGGLERTELLDAYVHMGACRAVLGRRAHALVAFRSAAALDPKFTTPAEVGKKASSLAERARRDETKAQPLKLTVSAPTTVPAGASFVVDATLDAAHLGAVSKVALDAREPSSGASFAALQAPSADVHFEIPARLVTGDATLAIRVTALDSHDNKLASVEQKTRVDAAPGVANANANANAMAPSAISLHPAPSRAAMSDTGVSDARALPPSRTGLWSSPWTYLVGGVALAAGGAALYLGTRPSDDVTIGAVRVQAR